MREVLVLFMFEGFQNFLLWHSALCSAQTNLEEKKVEFTKVILNNDYQFIPKAKFFCEENTLNSKESED